MKFGIALWVAGFLGFVLIAPTMSTAQRVGVLMCGVAVGVGITLCALRR